MSQKLRKALLGLLATIQVDGLHTHDYDYAIAEIFALVGNLYLHSLDLHSYNINILAKFSNHLFIYVIANNSTFKKS